MVETSAAVSPGQETDEVLYEGMFLVDSAKFASDPDGVTKEILGVLEKVGATVVAHRPWQDGKLAYEVAGHRRGLHYLTYFRMPGRAVTDLNRACKLNETVLRHLVISQPETLFDAMVASLSGEDHSEAGEESQDGTSEVTETEKEE